MLWRRSMVQAVLQSSQAQGIPPEALRGRGRVGDQERLLSGMLGAALLVGGLRRGGVSGITSMAVGGALIGRGATGYCPFYASFRENPAERQVAEELGWKHAAAVSRSITVQKPRSEVYRFWRDLRNLPRFMHNI